MSYHVSHLRAFTQAFSLTTNLEKDGFGEVAPKIAIKMTDNYKNLKKTTLIPFWSTACAIMTFKKVRQDRHLDVRQKNALLARQILALVPVGGNFFILVLDTGAQVIKLTCYRKHRSKRLSLN